MEIETLLITCKAGDQIRAVFTTATQTGGFMKSNRFLLYIIIPLLCLKTVLPLYAQDGKSGYVSDMLILTVREGPGKNFAVKKTIRSDTSVEILSREGNYFHVRLRDGTRGWVEKQYITFEKPDAVKIETLEKKIDTLEKENKKLTDAVLPLKEKIGKVTAGFEKTIEDLNKSLAEVTAEKNRWQERYAALEKKHQTLVENSENVTEVMAENERLQQKTHTLSRKVAALEAENQNILKTGMIKWFLAGAGVLLSGLIIGRGLSSKKRSSGSLIS